MPDFTSSSPKCYICYILWFGCNIGKSSPSLHDRALQDNQLPKSIPANPYNAVYLRFQAL
jgi:hypothetical protein